MRLTSLLLLALPATALAAATEPNAPPAGTPLKVEVPDEKPADQAGLPPGAVLRLGEPRGPRVLERQFAFSPDGKYIAAGTTDRLVKVWEVESRKVVHTFGPFEPSGLSSQIIAKSVFSPDGKALAVAAGKVAHLIDLAAGKEVGRLEGHTHIINDLAFSPDGARIVTGAHDQTAVVWDRGRFKQLHALGKFNDAVYGVAVSPDGATAAAADYKGVIRLWKMSDGTPVRDLAGLKSMVTSLHFADGGKTLTATTYDDGFVTWDVTSGEVKRRVADWKGWAALSPDGTRLAAAKDYYGTGPVTVWDVKSGKPVGKTAAELGGTMAIALAPDNKTLGTYGGDGILRFWKVPSGEEIGRPVGHQDRVSGVGFTRDGKQVISCGEDGTVRFWDAVTGKEVKRLSARGEHVHALALSPDGKTLALVGSNVPQRWRWGAQDTVRTTSLRYFDIDAGKETRAFHLGGETAHWIRFTGDGREVFAISWSGASLIDAATGKQRHLPVEAKQGLPAGDVSPDGRYAATSTNVPALRQIGKVAYFDLKENKEAFSKTFYLGGYSGLAFSPDGRHLAVAGSRDFRGDKKKLASPLQLWEVPGDKVAREFETDDSDARHLTFSRDGRMLATVEAKGIAVYEVATGRRRHLFKGHEGGVNCVAFARDGKRFASGGLDARVLVWDLSGLDGPAAKLEPKDLDALWNSLASEEGPVGAKAVGRLQARPQEALPYLRLRLTVLSEADVRRIEQLVNDLDDPQFKVRDTAAKEIERIGEPAVPVLKRAAAKGSTEVRQAAERLLKKIGDGEDPATSADTRRLIRAVEALERIGGDEARSLLKDLARRGGKLVPVREAEGALKRFEETQ